MFEESGDPPLGGKRALTDHGQNDDGKRWLKESMVSWTQRSMDPSGAPGHGLANTRWSTKRFSGPFSCRCRCWGMEIFFLDDQVADLVQNGPFWEIFFPWVIEKSIQEFLDDSFILWKHLQQRSPKNLPLQIKKHRVFLHQVPWEGPNVGSQEGKILHHSACIKNPEKSKTKNHRLVCRAKTF